MNRQTNTCLCILSALVAVPAFSQTLVSSAFTYQGRLNFNGAPANGTYDFIFRLYGASVGGTLHGNAVVNDLTVTNGLFTTSLNFGTLAFAGDARWLQIEVRPGNSTGAYTVLPQRQELLPTPWAHAIRLPYIGSVGTSGTAFQLSQNGAGGVMSIIGSTTGTSAALNVSSPSSTSTGHAASFTKSGTGSNAAVRASGTKGGRVLDLSYDDAAQAGFVIAATSNSPSGYAIQSITTGGADNIYALNLEGAGDCIFAQQGGLFGSSGDGRVAFLAQNVSANPSDAVEIEQDGTGDGLYVHIDNAANSAVGVNVLTVGTGRAARFQVNNSSSTLSAVLATTNGSGSAIGATNTGTGRAGTFQISNASNSQAALYCSTTGTGPALHADGLARVDILEITGADVAEKFPVSEDLKPGMVAAIDPANPGKLCLARGAYNHRVAGVVSGAGDVPVGAILGNMPQSENGPPIALSGRVWVMCDASEHAIEPGDLLTTSDTAGQAMKAADHARASGATLGKAMSSLAKGESGLVLVLVNLQ